MDKIIGVIGAGVMGKGVAERFAQYGYKIVLLDIDDNIISTAKADITRSLRFRGMMDKSINAAEIVERISVTNNYDDIANADFVIENVCEQEEIKKGVYEKLDKVCKPKSIFMVNTSCIPITRIGSYTNRAENIIGVHLMNPVPMKNFAEVIKGWKTSQNTIDSVKALLESVKISCEIINDSAGFVSNRLSHLFMNEAAFLVYEGVATAAQIDSIFRNAFGHKMGPLETADLIGIDTVVDSLEVLYKEYEDSKFKVCPLLRRMVEVNETGRKTKKGFYKY